MQATPLIRQDFHLARWSLIPAPSYAVETSVDLALEGLKEVIKAWSSV